MSAAGVLPLLVFVLAACSVGSLLVVALHPRLTGRAALDGRVDLMTELAGAPSSGGDTARKRSVEDTLKEAEQKLKRTRKGRNKASLVMRMRQADLDWGRKRYYAICVGVGSIVLAVLLVASGLGTFTAIGFSLAAGALLPHMFVGFKRKRRFKRFGAEFPNAIDVIVRGIKSGLPLVDCLKIIASEAVEPVRSEFRAIIDDQTMGMPLPEAVQRLPERIPVSDANFFAIVIAIQSRTGGSLSETLANLSGVLRERKKMQAKIKAMSAEAKASGGIIGSLPIIVGGLVYLTSPAYIGLLFTETTGNIVLAVSGLWMMTGILVMKKMINFDF